MNSFDFGRFRCLRFVFSLFEDFSVLVTPFNFDNALMRGYLYSSNLLESFVALSTFSLHKISNHRKVSLPFHFKRLFSFGGNGLCRKIINNFSISYLRIISYQELPKTQRVP